MSISFRKGGGPREKTPTENLIPSHLEPSGHIQRGDRAFRDRLSAMNQAELKDFFHQEWEELETIMYEQGRMRWASQHHGEEIQLLNSKTLNLYQSYQMMDDVVRGELSEELSWPYTPLPVGRISYIEWILFCLKEVELEHYPEQIGD